MGKVFGGSQGHNPKCTPCQEAHARRRGKSLRSWGEAIRIIFPCYNYIFKLNLIDIKACKARNKDKPKFWGKETMNNGFPIKVI